MWTEEQLRAAGLVKRRQIQLNDEILRVAALANTVLTAAATAWGTAAPLVWLGGLAGPVGVGVGAAAGPVLATLAGLYSIGLAHEIGANQGARMAWKLGFAYSLMSFAKDRRPYLSGIGNYGQAVRGMNAVIRMCNEMEDAQRRTFLSRWNLRSSSAARHRALLDVGGLEVGSGRITY